ncbi:MAG: DUF1566 domain-containing protein [Candidatus Undinarchaeales archaeon]|jgi:hypothetical protein|nr:DUF1566 domain-containing protein [Candidatus Undinarchaeales archaeon]
MERSIENKWRRTALLASGLVVIVILAMVIREPPPPKALNEAERASGHMGTVSTIGIIDTGQDRCYDTSQEIPCPRPGEAFYGQDSQYEGDQFSYIDNGDGTVTDLNTGLMWQKDPGDKVTFDDALTIADTLELAGHDDWRVPTIKELYTLMDFRGGSGRTEAESTPYLDTTIFEFRFGDTSAGERLIDAQFLSSNEYVSTTMNNDATVFGVNFADGRIKGYPKLDPRSRTGKPMFVRYVRGNAYGENAFVDNGDGTVTDNSTGLTWLQQDSGGHKAGANGGLDWEQALSWCEGLSYAGHDDWRLPNAKELQGIVDYTRSPDTTSSPAIDPVFATSSITDEGGSTNYPFFWTGTTHLEGGRAEAAVYVAFGEALGFMRMPPYSLDTTLMDVHGAGAQRSDPKTGDPSAYPTGRGPQGDVIRIYNYARCVRG